MKTYKTLIILKKVYSLLKEIKLQGILSGEKIDVDIIQVCDALLQQNKLNEFLQIITKTDINFEDYDIDQIGDIISDFLSKFSKVMKKMNPQQAPQQNQNPQAPQKSKD